MMLKDKSFRTIIIGLVLLFLLTIGATYAYFSVTTINNFNSRIINAQAEAIGSVAIDQNVASLRISLNEEHMAKNINNIRYYATTDPNGVPTTSENIVTVATASVVGPGYHDCDYTLTVSESGTNDMYTAFQGMANKSYDQIVLNINGRDYDFYNSNLFDIEYHGTFTHLFEGRDKYIKVSFYIANKPNVVQDDLADTDIKLDLNISNISCRVVDGANVMAQNTVYIHYGMAKIFYSSLDSSTETLLNYLLDQYVHSGLTYDQIDYGGDEIPGSPSDSDMYLNGNYGYAYDSSIDMWRYVIIDSSIPGSPLSSINGKDVYEPLIPANAAYYGSSDDALFYSSIDTETGTVLNYLLQEGGFSATYDQIPYGGSEFPNTVYNNDYYVEGNYVYMFDSSRDMWDAMSIDGTDTGTKLNKINGKLVNNYPRSSSIPANAVYLNQSNGTIYYSSLDSTTEYIVNLALSEYVQTGLTYDMLNYGGSSYPSTIENDDRYLYGDYGYTYEESTHGWWAVALDKTKSSYTSMLNSINGAPIKRIESAYYGCTNLVIAPSIPDTVVYMNYAFYNNTSLITAPIIPDGVRDMLYTFYNNTSLQEAPAIPSSVNDMDDVFEGCTSLGGNPEVNANPMYYSNAFYNTQITGISGSTILKEELFATK